MGCDIGGPSSTRDCNMIVGYKSRWFVTLTQIFVSSSLGVGEPPRERPLPALCPLLLGRLWDGLSSVRERRGVAVQGEVDGACGAVALLGESELGRPGHPMVLPDRKSTRLNSSHSQISYA